jgi:hypothetical protein
MNTFKQAYDKLRSIKLNSYLSKKLTFKQAYYKLRSIKLNLKKKDYI